jgi:putative oxidoreductase
MILNTFPDLLTYQIFAPFILRVIVGFIVINLGYLKFGKEKTQWKELFETIHFHPAELCTKILATVEIVGGLFLLAGAYTQITAMVFAVLFFCEAVLEYREEDLESRNLTFYILMFAIVLSLIFLGAGIFALDSAL